MSEQHTCPVCRGPIELREAVPIAINPQDVTNEQVAEAYEVAKAEEAAEPSTRIRRSLYLSAGASRIDAHADGRDISDVPQEELAALGRAMFALGAKSYAVHRECAVSDAFVAWLETQGLPLRSEQIAAMRERVRRRRG